MVTADIADLPVAEKLKLMETLWDSLCKSASGIESPDWHRDVLAERMRRIDGGADSVSSWQEAKERIRNQTKAG